MTIAMRAIYTQIVGAGGASSITFNNIPQGFTDLMILASARTTRTDFATDIFNFTVNGTSTLQSGRRIEGVGNGVTSSTGPYIANAASNASTANTFGSASIYIPNYASSQFKQIVSDGVSENNATNAWQVLAATLWSSSSVITSFGLSPNSGANFVQYSTFTLYGITKG